MHFPVQILSNWIVMNLRLVNTSSNGYIDFAEDISVRCHQFSSGLPYVVKVMKHSSSVVLSDMIELNLSKMDYKGSILLRPYRVGHKLVFGMRVSYQRSKTRWNFDDEIPGSSA